ncbi:MAG: MFS transporter [Leptospirillia bacterium]
MAKANGMSAIERRATMSLAGIFSLRMFGLFLVLPVFATYAHTLVGATPALLGFALGVYGLTQALLQVPFGMVSDRIGRKPVITAGLLLFVAGSLLCAEAGTIWEMVVGRALQGSGAVAAAIVAMMGDLTSEENRTKAMAMVGGGIAMAFAVSMVAGPLIAAAWGVNSLFKLVATFAALSIVLLWVAVPTPEVVRHHRDMELTGSDLSRVLADGNLMRLNIGVFVLHMALTAIFVAVPLMLARSLPTADLWKVYLPVILVSFAIMVPSTIMAEARGKIRQVVLIGIGVVAISQVVLLAVSDSTAGVIAGLVVFFIGFNMLEPVMPSLVTKFSPAGARGTGSGVFNTFQFMGPFVGGSVGGMLYDISPHALFGFVLVCALIWLAVAFGMVAPVPYRQLVVPLSLAEGVAIERVKEALTALAGVGEVRIFEEDGEAHVRFLAKQVDVDTIFGAVRSLSRA